MNNEIKVIERMGCEYRDSEYFLKMRHGSPARW